MIKSFFLSLAVSILLLALPVFIPQAVLASSQPGFSSCSSPSGVVLANYSDGSHGIPGDVGTYTGSDAVYDQGSGNALQCFCGGGGTQTEWWNISDMSVSEIQSYESQGWVYVPDGSQWGLQEGQYLALNSSYSCSGGTGSVQGASTSSSGGGGGGSPPVCNDTAPGGAPRLVSAVSNGANSVTLTWTPAPDPVTYYLLTYGTTPGAQTYGNPNVGGHGTTSYTVSGLSGGTTYYFRIRAGNGCTPGPYSNELSTRAGGGALTGPAVGFVPGVLGVTTQASPEPTPSATEAVKGLETQALACAKCLWWPLLLLETGILVLLYALKNNKKNLSKKRLFAGLVVGLIIYLIFLLINHACLDGRMNLILFTLPCRMFWLLDIAVFVVISLIYGKVLAKKAVSTKKNTK